MKEKTKAVADFFDQNTYLKNTFNIKLRKRIIQELIKTSPLPKNVLDIGCGDGSLSAFLAGKSDLTLIDISDKMLELVRERLTRNTKTGITILKGDILELELNQKFDLILCIGVLAHVASINAVLEKITRLLAPGGRAIIQISDTSHFRYRNDNFNTTGYGYRLNKINKSAFLSQLNKSGFKVLQVKGYPWSFFPLTWLSQKTQYTVLNFLRKTPLGSFLNSEWLFSVNLISKK